MPTVFDGFSDHKGDSSSWVGPLPPEKFSADALTAQEWSDFEADGFLIRPEIFHPEELVSFEEAFDRLEERAKALSSTRPMEGASFVMGPTGPGGATTLQRVVWCGAAESELMAAGLDPRILRPALELLGSRSADQLINQAHFKRPGDGVEFPLHQDAWNRRFGTALWRDRSSDGAYVQVVLTLDSMHPGNGPLLVVPGSHRWGPILGVDRHLQVEARLGDAAPVPLRAPSGSLIFFGPFLVHGSEPNHGAGPRRLLVNGFARPGVNRRRYPGAGLGVRRSFPQREAGFG